MQTREEYIQTLSSHMADLNQRFGIRHLRLFGSVARNEQREDSDVDLFAEMPDDLFNSISAVDYLEELLGCKVDLICDHKNMRPFFRNQIEKYGIDILPTA